MRLKKVMATGLVAALALSTMVGCSSKKDSSDQKKIGVVQLVEHDALDASYKGFKDGLEKAGYKDGDKIKIEYKNAQNEQSNCQTIAKQFVTDKCDLVLAIATPAAQAMANESKDIPILVTAVTDPADAKLVKSNKKPGTNVSGTSDLTPVAKQMNLRINSKCKESCNVILFCRSKLQIPGRTCEERSKEIRINNSRCNSIRIQ